MGAFALLLLIAAPQAALAHDGTSHWSAEPWVVLPTAIAAALYARGVANLWRHAGRGRGITYGQVASFVAGIASIVFALMSPLDSSGGRYFSLHMVQHETLMLVTAPVMVLARPLAAWAWAFSPRRRRSVGHAVKARWWSAVWSFITDPLVAWLAHALALWVWHVPRFFEAAVENEGVHALQHTSFLVTALLFWWAVIGRDARSRQGSGAALAYLFTTMLHTSALGALLTLASSPWYPRYGLEDQQLGGLVMWVPGATAYVVAALMIVARLLRPATPAGLAPLRSGG
jgi:putative membrane protein